MRVLVEYKNKRVDIKTPISMRQKIEESPELLAQLIEQVLGAFGFNNKEKKASFDMIVKQLNKKGK